MKSGPDSPVSLLKYAWEGAETSVSKNQNRFAIIRDGLRTQPTVFSEKRKSVRFVSFFFPFFVALVMTVPERALLRRLLTSAALPTKKADIAKHPDNKANKWKHVCRRFLPGDISFFCLPPNVSIELKFGRPDMSSFVHSLDCAKATALGLVINSNTALI